MPQAEEPDIVFANQLFRTFCMYCQACPNFYLPDKKYESLIWYVAIRQADEECKRLKLSREEFIKLGKQYREDGWRGSFTTLWKVQRVYTDAQRWMEAQR